MEEWLPHPARQHPPGAGWDALNPPPGNTHHLELMGRLQEVQSRGLADCAHQTRVLASRARQQASLVHSAASQILNRSVGKEPESPASLDRPNLSPLSTSLIDPPLWQSPRRARLYVWGYGCSSPWMSGYQCRQSAAARSFAIERGWEPDRPESWAVEIPCPSGLHPVLREIEPILRADPAVAGWGGQTASVFSPLQTAVPALRSARDEVERSAPQDNLIERSRTVLNASHAVRAETARLIKKAWQHRREMQQQLDRLAEIPWCRRGADRQRHPALDPAPTPVSSDESILPDPLFDTLNRTVSHSLALAEQGRLVEGYSLLLSGLHDAEEAALELSPWAPQLMQIYQRALENYVWRFGVRLD